MRSALLSTLAVLGLSASRVLATPVCNTKHDAGIAPTTQELQAAQNCIKQVCSGQTRNFVDEECGIIHLKITQSDTSSPTASDCVTHFGAILDQCISTERIGGGTVQTEQALYEVHEAAEHSHTEGQSLEEEEDAENGPLVARRVRGGRTRWARAKATKSKTSKPTKPETKPETKPRTKPDKKPNNTPKATPKATPKSTPNAKSSTTLKPSPTAEPKPQKCQNTRQPGTKRPGAKTEKKTVRDVIDGFLPQVLRRAGTPSGSTPPTASPNSCEPDISKYYKQTDLNKKKVIHWRFETQEGWKKAVGEDKRAAKYREVMNKMHVKGKFDVVRLARGKASVVGSAQVPSTFKDFSSKAGNYMLSNANFFVQPGKEGLFTDYPHNEPLDTDRYGSWAVGETSSTQQSIKRPSIHEEFYARFNGDDNTFLYSGPDLTKNPLDLEDKRLQYFEDDAKTIPSPYTKIPGGMATANQPNERLITAIFRDGSRYLFAYTSRREDGMDLNEMRELIGVFMNQYFNKSLKDAKQILNLDGGPSIYVAWISGRKEKILARGGRFDPRPARLVFPSLLKISA